MLTKGKLIVIEGADGTGKATQTAMLLDWLQKSGCKAATMDFPAYNTQYGKEIKAFLEGKYGNPIDLDPYFAACFYIVDRFNVKNKLLKLLKDNDFVVLDRYACSNLAHQGIKIKNTNEKIRFEKWDEKVEYTQLELPKPDLVVVLRLNAKISQKLMKSKDQDIHESDYKYQQKVRQAYEHLLRHRKDWQSVVCDNGRDNILSKKAIHKKVREIIGKRWDVL